MSWKQIAISKIIQKPITGEWGNNPSGISGVKVIRTTNFSNDGKLDLSKGVVIRDIVDKKIATKKLQYGDTIIEKSGGSPNQPVGRVIFFDQKEEDFLCNNFTSVLRAKEGTHSKYFFYCMYNLHLRGITRSFQNKTTGIINLQLKRYLDKVQIPLPPLPIQKRIAGLLDKADALRQKDRELLEQYDRLAESVFLEMFGQKTKDYSKWEEVKINKLAKPVKGGMRTGPFGSNLKHEEFMEDGEVAVLGIDNAVENFFKWGKKRFISREKYNELRRYTIFPRDVIITIMGTLGRTAVIPNDIPLAINTKHLAALTLNQEYANPYFIAFCIRSHPYVLAQINANTRGAIMAGLNLTIVKELKIKLPPVALQDHFEKLLGNIESQKEIVRIQMERSEALFQSLLQKAFRGELFQEQLDQETVVQE